MKYHIGLFFGVWLCLLFIPVPACAAVKINEVAWMGTAGSQYSEWVELHNTGSEAVSLAGWKLWKTGNEVVFTLSKTIAAGGYLLIEHTTPSAPDAVAGINDESGAFENGGLKNSGEDLSLRDKEGTVIDDLSFANGWPAGDAKTKQTMQWNGTTWITAIATPDAATAIETVNVPATLVATSQVMPVQTVPVTIVQTPAVTAIVQSTVSSPSPSATVVPPVSSSNSTIVPASPVIVPTVVAPVASISVPKSAPNVSMKQKITKTNTVKSSGSKIAPDTAENDANANQLQDNTDAADIPKENNHIKTIVLGAVAFIGMALLLLLARFKASQE